MDAAMPPSAMTVCALPSSDLQTTATFAPALCASMAARSPAPPAPMTTTSYSWTSVVPEAPVGVVMSGDPDLVVDAVGADHPDVHVGERDTEQGDPGELHVAVVELGHPGPEPVAHRVLGEVVEAAAHDVPAAVAAQAVQPQQRRV